MQVCIFHIFCFGKEAQGLLNIKIILLFLTMGQKVVRVRSVAAILVFKSCIKMVDV